MRKLIYLCATCLLVFFPAVGDAQPLTKEQVASLSEVALIPEYDEAIPGELFTVGFLVKLKPDWHVYWSYPGDAGLPTRVETEQLQTGELEDLEFPLPIEFLQPSGDKGFGYEKEVFFRLPIRVSAQASESQQLLWSGDLRWLLCSDRLCIPGKESLEVKVPIGSGHDGERNAIHREWDSKFPKKAESGMFHVVSDKFEEGTRKINLLVEWGQDPISPKVFVDAGRTSEVVSQIVPEGPLVSKISLEIRWVPKESQTENITVLVTEGEGEDRVGFEHVI